MRLLIIATLLSSPSLGHATVGGPDHLEVLGYEPVDGKLYYLVHLGGEIVAAPQLFFFALKSAKPSLRRAARSWYAGLREEAGMAAFPKRLAKLKARLRPLPAAPREGITVQIKHHDLQICGDAPNPPKTREQARAIIAAFRREGRDPDNPVCERVEVSVEWAGYAGQVTVESWDSPSLLTVHRLPDPRFVLAIVRYVGKHFEVGYTEETPMLLHRVEEAGLQTL